MPGYVYLIGSIRYKWYKIGKSSHAAIRISELGILLPFKIHVIAVWKTEAYHALERQLHEKYAERRINGEWFKLGKNAVQTLVKDLSYLSTSITTEFSNIQYREIKPFILTPEECERRKQESIAIKALRPRCESCGHILPKKKYCA